jgi:mono/diheme cytochrome c family protein
MLMVRRNVYRYHVTGGGGRNSLIFLIYLLVALSLCSFAGLIHAQSAEEGEAIFEAKCTACHTIGGGDTVGPDLKGITSIRERDWLLRFISSPNKMISEGDPIALELFEKFNKVPMPNMGLSEKKVSSILAYLETTGTSQAKAPSTQPSVSKETEVTEGHAIEGLNLFTGYIPFEKGGAPCIACHSIAGISALGGGTLGPDLTETFEDYGEKDLISVLASVPFPTMNPVYYDHPISPQEQAHLVAFMKEAVDKQMSSSAGQLSMLVAGIFLAILALTWLLWRNRLREVRKTLVEESRKRRAK